MADTALIACETVRKADYDRYLAALLASAPKRPHLFALYAFNYEVAKTAESVREPIAAAIRLQWWRDAIDGIYTGKKEQTGIMPLLNEAIAAHDLPRALFDGLIESREHDLDEAPFNDMAELEAYADASSGNVMRLSARILGAGEAFDVLCRHAGIAYALTGLLRALPYHAARHRLMMPADVVKQAGLSTEEIFAGPDPARAAALVSAIAKPALAHWNLARRSVPRRFLPALAPASLAPLYLKPMMRGFDPFREAVDIPVFRRQLAMIGAMARGRL